VTPAALVQHDPAGQRFTLDRDGRVSYLLYRPTDDHTVDFVSTWVHPELRGHGIGARLVEHALRWAEEEGYRVIPSCWFVAEYVERTPRYQPLLVTS
jgi:predicted GNAT family acetyltransferase